MSDSFFPGWQATVNGVDASIQPANYAFKAVVVPVGRVEVELRYVPPGLMLGLAVSGLAVLIVCLLGYGARLSVFPRPGRDQHLASEEREERAVPNGGRQDAEHRPHDRAPLGTVELQHLVHIRRG